MKFLAFNILVGGALAWLLLGGTGSSAALLAKLPSLIPGTEQVEQVAMSCPAPGGLDTPTTAKTAVAAPLVQAAVASEPAGAMAEPRFDKPAASAAVLTVAAAKPAPSPTPGQTTEPQRVPVGRRDALMSLAENMELFSLERVAK